MLYIQANVIPGPSEAEKILLSSIMPSLRCVFVCTLVG